MKLLSRALGLNTLWARPIIIIARGMNLLWVKLINSAGWGGPAIFVQGLWWYGFAITSKLWRWLYFAVFVAALSAHIINGLVALQCPVSSTWVAPGWRLLATASRSRVVITWISGSGSGDVTRSSSTWWISIPR